MKAILFAIRTCKDQLKHEHVQIFPDSTTAVNYINNMNSIKSISSNSWVFCKINNIWISAAHISEHENRADRPSREYKDDVEWEIDQEIFSFITDIWGYLEND